MDQAAAASSHLLKREHSIMDEISLSNLPIDDNNNKSDNNLDHENFSQLKESSISIHDKSEYRKLSSQVHSNPS